MNQSILNNSELVKELLDAEISKSDIPGIQYLVLDSSRIIFEYAGSWADIENRIPMQSSTSMMAFSMTKTITAAAVMQLIEKGGLNLDDSVDKYISNNPYGRNITIRQLLSHTSGIPSPIPLKWVHLAKNHEEFDEDAALDLVLKENPKPDFKPGTKYAYSNISYWLLGKIIEEVSGQSYTAYMREHILDPLQLTRAEMNYTIPDYASHAKGYLAKYSFLNLFKGFLMDKELSGAYEGHWLHINNLYLNGPSFGGLIGSARSFGKFLQDQMKEKSVLFNNETRNLFNTQQKTGAGELIDMTLGWHVNQLEEAKYYYKQGGGAGYRCEMRIYPAHGIATVIIVNRTSFNTRKYLNMLDEKFLPN